MYSKTVTIFNSIRPFQFFLRCFLLAPIFKPAGNTVVAPARRRGVTMTVRIFGAEDEGEMEKDSQQMDRQGGYKVHKLRQYP